PEQRGVGRSRGPVTRRLVRTVLLACIPAVEAVAVVQSLAIGERGVAVPLCERGGGTVVANLVVDVHGERAGAGVRERDRAARRRRLGGDLDERAVRQRSRVEAARDGGALPQPPPRALQDIS